MRKRGIYSFVIVFLFFLSCSQDYSPKPRGYFNIKFPEKKYQSFTSDCPYSFEFPVYAKVIPDSKKDAKPCWLDVSYPDFNGRIHLSYQPVHSPSEFNQLVEDARTFAFKHTVKATAIDEGLISYPEKNVYGIYYSIDGNTASSVQFFLTDSTKNYLRGALYFNEQPRLDSIQPVLEFIKKDIDVMIKSFKWKNQ
ncbi:gliding motility lipoprotein GldD [Daejeonella lutea]|uniref:Gliding motility-associated lipoprotein GldD n=1 Tax=Daejeonella lutea TaxID=572036 RepID=A0A1T5DVM5_9SPHI|nr:gliding motility lipoprotein GldD [Daejeonella lutea]SKB75699.1 gliding motility-associated lipoprotein GldD [Daejeonella lutea]